MERHLCHRGHDGMRRAASSGRGPVDVAQVQAARGADEAAAARRPQEAPEETGQQ